jgi:hypothetical protein
MLPNSARAGVHEVLKKAFMSTLPKHNAEVEREAFETKRHRHSWSGNCSRKLGIACWTMTLSANVLSYSHSADVPIYPYQAKASIAGVSTSLDINLW